jgi:hypothetical protein
MRDVPRQRRPESATCGTFASARTHWTRISDGFELARAAEHAPAGILTAKRRPSIISSHEMSSNGLRRTTSDEDLASRQRRLRACSQGASIATTRGWSGAGRFATSTTASMYVDPSFPPEQSSTQGRVRKGVTFHMRREPNGRAYGSLRRWAMANSREGYEAHARGVAAKSSSTPSAAPTTTSQSSIHDGLDEFVGKKVLPDQTSGSADEGHTRCARTPPAVFSGSSVRGPLRRPARSWQRNGDGDKKDLWCWSHEEHRPEQHPDVPNTLPLTLNRARREHLRVPTTRDLTASSASSFARASSGGTCGVGNVPAHRLRARRRHQLNHGCGRVFPTTAGTPWAAWRRSSPATSSARSLHLHTGSGSNIPDPDDQALRGAAVCRYRRRC